MLLLALTAVLAAFADPAVAQTAVQEAVPATPEQIAAARAEADRLIATAGAEAWFENITVDATPRVEHHPSGLICSFYGSVDDRIVVFPAGGMGLARGDDVGCATAIGGTFDMDISVYASRFADRLSASAALEAANAAIQARYPDAEPYHGQLARAGRDGGPFPLLSAWRLTMGERDSVSIALVANNAEWSFKARVSGPYDEAMAVSLVAGSQLLMSVESVTGWPPQAATD